MDAIDIMIFDLQDVGCRFYTNINVCEISWKPAPRTEKNC